MEIEINSSNAEHSHRALLVSDVNNSNLLSEDDRVRITRFVNSSKNSVFLNEFDRSHFLVKSTDDAEKMRKFGADYRSKLDPGD